MFMPVDPNSVNGMWDKLLQSLSSQKSCIVVSHGDPSLSFHLISAQDMSQI